MMAEFSEVIRQKKRMCNSILCCKCDIYLLCGEDLSGCPRFIHNNPKMAEEVIMSWAAEHPEPVYPSWMDFLVKQDGCKDAYNGGNDTLWKWMWTTPIPADIAQKLGIEPKEG